MANVDLTPVETRKAVSQNVDRPFADDNEPESSDFDLESVDFEELGLALRNALAVVETCRILSIRSVSNVAEDHGLGDITVPDALLCAYGEIKRAVKMLGPYGGSWNEAPGLAERSE